MRLLPILIITLLLTLGVRVNHLVVEGRHVVETALVQSSIAEEETPPTEEKKPTTDEEKKATGDEKAPAADTKEAEAKKTETEAPEPVPGTIALPDMNGKGCEFSQTELDILQSLAKRRELIDEQAKSLELKSGVLKATELNIEKKISEMRDLKKTVEDLLKLYDQKEQEKIRSLVKIYENMKPKDAARIFEQLDMDVLLQVIDKMDEKRIAPILANVAPTRAQEITVKLAERRKLPKMDAIEEPENASPETAAPEVPAENKEKAATAEQ